MRLKDFDYWKNAIYLKILLLCISVLLSVFWTYAQTDPQRKFAHGFSMATRDASNISYSLGQPFAKQLESPSYSVAEGVMQAQLIRHNMYLAG